MLALGIFLWAFSAFFSVAIMVTPFEHFVFCINKNCGAWNFIEGICDFGIVFELIGSNFRKY